MAKMSTTLLPFLYQTRTIRRATRGSISLSLLRSFQTSGGRSHPRQQSRSKTDEHNVPFEWEGSQAEEQTKYYNSGSSERKSTITPFEKRIFKDIFADIANRGNASNSAKDHAPASETGQDPNNMIVQNAKAARKQAEPLSNLAPADQVRNANNRDTILLNYPPSLRRAAQITLGMHQRPALLSGTAPLEYSAADEGLDAEKLMQLSQWEAVRESETARLTDLMTRCATDLEAWDLMEREIFSMVERLGIAENAKELKGKKNRKWESKVTGSEAQELSMDSHGPLYSVLLLLGLKTLDQAFALPSPLALNILPRINELGLASYVLGVSTPFYNELASIYWYRQGDAKSVFNILEEMRYAGLYFDAQTLALLKSIQRSLESCSEGQLGSFAKAITTMPDYSIAVMSKLGHWIRQIQDMTQDSDKDSSY